MKMQNKRIGIYGGSFNPIHQGHVHLGLALCDSGAIDELWYMVSPQNPLKVGVTDLLDEQARLAMTRLATQAHPRLKACDFEFALPRPSFMVNTLAALRKAYPHNVFSLVIGADNWHSFAHWHQPDEIMRHHDIIIYPRQGYSITEPLPQGVKLINTPLFNISSTEMREVIAQGGDASYGLHPAVWQYIREHGCYNTKIE